MMIGPLSDGLSPRYGAIICLTRACRARPHTVIEPIRMWDAEQRIDGSQICLRALRSSKWLSLTQRASSLWDRLRATACNDPRRLPGLLAIGTSPGSATRRAHSPHHHRPLSVPCSSPRLRRAPPVHPQSGQQAHSTPAVSPATAWILRWRVSSQTTLAGTPRPILSSSLNHCSFWGADPLKPRRSVIDSYLPDGTASKRVCDGLPCGRLPCTPRPLFPGALTSNAPNVSVWESDRPAEPRKKGTGCGRSRLSRRFSGPKHTTHSPTPSHPCPDGGRWPRAACDLGGTASENASVCRTSDGCCRSEPDGRGVGMSSGWLIGHLQVGFPRRFRRMCEGKTVGWA
ncbi:hypothetical protein C8Q80DRAFT_873251 [Daedaleopsis nitida]|nr:hypothetical protein C8Q80DRAFT_873251 [Daedaleopsis nitida]